MKKQLKDFGLSDSEINIYLYLLENGLSTPTQISKELKITRTNVYPILSDLKRLNLVDENTKRGRKIFTAKDPISLIEEVDRKKKAIEEIVSDLRGLYKTKKNKPVIKFYDGFEQVKQIYFDTYEAGEVYAFGSIKQLDKLSNKFIKSYFKGLRKRNIVLKDLLTYPSGEKVISEMKKELGVFYEPHVLPKKYGDIPTDLLIWNDNIAIILLTEPIFGTVLEHPHLALSFRTLFMMSWQSSGSFR
jgi:sugar-specific transcriptional regulator TrmB